MAVALRVARAEFVFDRHAAVQHRRRVARRVGHAHYQVMQTVADLGRVEAHIRRHRFQTGLQVEERRQSVGGLADVSTVPAVFVDHGFLHDATVDVEDRLVHARSWVRAAEDQIARVVQGLFARERTAHVTCTRSFILLEHEVSGVQVGDSSVAMFITDTRRAFKFGYSLARCLHVEMCPEVCARHRQSIFGCQGLARRANAG